MSSSDFLVWSDISAQCLLEYIGVAVKPLDSEMSDYRARENDKAAFLGGN